MVGCNMLTGVKAFIINIKLTLNTQVLLYLEKHNQRHGNNIPNLYIKEPRSDNF